MGMIDQTTVSEFIMIQESTEFERIPSGEFAKHKLVITLSLIVDLIVLTGILLNIITLQISDSLWLASAHIISLFVILSIFLATIYAFYGLLTMNLSKFSFVVFTWVSIIISVFLMLSTLFISLILSFNASGVSERLFFQTSTCLFFRTDSYCELTKTDFFMVTAVISAAIFCFKCGQIICLRALCCEAHDYLSTRSHKSSTRSRPNNSTHQSDSDDDDVVVFEKVSGRFPGKSSIKDASIA
ncbi:unnamed protein product [Caenorhabditis angaria]|uniref:Uncharacterized protein n=1 Tax=Caenorhabditis angaria TaxID=860376 RepID=A0A9P1J3Z1_9PELO|nr:unnamed protein product [Caenorhabditis angaria]